MTDHLHVCRECRKPIDMREVNAVLVGAHGRDFCSMVCADAWEANPDNEDAARRSREQGGEPWVSMAWVLQEIVRILFPYTEDPNP
jgi:hypothetical protein